MKKCVNYETNEKCPNFYECGSEGGEFAKGSSIKKLQQFCYYCMGTPGIKKIGHKASWTGNTPKWCPLGRDKA